MPSTSDTGSAKSDPDRLRELIQRFVRSFGLLVTKETPCGQPLSPSYAHALMVLLEHAREDQPTSQAKLGAILGIDKSNVTRLCSRMEVAGHVTQEQAPGDGRSRLLSLTGAGRRLASRLEDASHQRFRQIVGALPRHERSTVFRSLAVLNTAIETLKEGGERP
jgi:DNA-binding MarR family transcriptional regulator